MRQRPRIAAIVCTYNRGDMLRNCLQGLATQSLPLDGYEVVVVDNNSTDHTFEVTADFCMNYPNFVAVGEGRQGLSAARNKGLATASAPLVAFVDDDAIAGPDWLERLASRFDELDKDVVMVGGDVDPVWGAEPPPWLSKDMMRALSAGLDWSNEARFVDGRDEWLFEGASGYRAQPLIDLGGFPEGLGRIGDILLSGEAALHFRLAEQGCRFFYDPGIRVRHHIHADRLTKAWLRRRYFWQGVTGHRVDQYLRRHGAQAIHPTRVDLPVSEGAWLSAFDDTDEGPFERALATLYDLGYLLAVQGVILGR